MKTTLRCLLSVLFLTFAHATWAADSVKHWAYQGRAHAGTMVESFQASASVDDDRLILFYNIREKRAFLQFRYKGSVALSAKHRDKAEMYIRTNHKTKQRGRLKSDYVFKGETIVVPNRDTRKDQIVLTQLTLEDIKALKRHEGGLMGVGYYLEGGRWKTYSFPTKGLWAAYQRVDAEGGRAARKLAAEKAAAAKSEENRLYEAIKAFRFVRPCTAPTQTCVHASLRALFVELDKFSQAHQDMTFTYSLNQDLTLNWNMGYSEARKYDVKLLSDWVRKFVNGLTESWMVRTVNGKKFAVARTKDDSFTVVALNKTRNKEVFELIWSKRDGTSISREATLVFRGARTFSCATTRKCRLIRAKNGQAFAMTLKGSEIVRLIQFKGGFFNNGSELGRISSTVGLRPALMELLK